MAKRQGTRRIDSSEVMGEGSYVDVTPIPYKTAREVMQMKDAGALSEAEQEAYVMNLVAGSIHGWDWVDEDGNALPVPANGDELAERLYVHEVHFLIRNLLPSEEQKKN